MKLRVKRKKLNKDGAIDLLVHKKIKNYGVILLIFDLYFFPKLNILIFGINIVKFALLILKHKLAKGF